MSKRTPQPPAHLSEAAKEAWHEVTGQHPHPDEIAGPQLEAYAITIARSRDATRRVDTEGSVVSDERGRPIPHPALEIERRAQQDIRDWGDKFTGRDDPLGLG